MDREGKRQQLYLKCTVLHILHGRGCLGIHGLGSTWFIKLAAGEVADSSPNTLLMRYGDMWFKYSAAIGHPDSRYCGLACVRVHPRAL